MKSAIYRLHDAVINCYDQNASGFCYLNLTGVTEFKFERKTKSILLLVAKDFI